MFVFFLVPWCIRLRKDGIANFLPSVLVVLHIYKALHPRNKDRSKQPFPGTVIDTMAPARAKTVVSARESRLSRVTMWDWYTHGVWHGYDIIRWWTSLWHAITTYKSYNSRYYDCLDSWLVSTKRWKQRLAKKQLWKKQTSPKHPFQTTTRSLGTEVLKSQVWGVSTRFRLQLLEQNPLRCIAPGWYRYTMIYCFNIS